MKLVKKLKDSHMKLKIINPYGSQEHTVAWIELNTPAGNMIIQDEHAPMIIEVSPNTEILFLLNSGKQMSMIIMQGFAHITRKEVRILATQQKES